MSQQKIRVLILDDISIHLEKIMEVIQPVYQVFEKNWKIDIIPIEVIVLEKDGNFSFDKSCIKKIEEASSEPFDLLLMDLGYRPSHLTQMGHILEEKYNENNNHITPKIWKSCGLLSPDDLVRGSENSNFKKNFVEHKKTIFGYTYTPGEWERLFYSIDGCKSMLTSAFPSARYIEAKGTRQELFNNNPKFEKIKDEEFYPYILAKYLEKLVHIEILKKEITNAKHLKIKRSFKAVGIFIFICGLLGACSEFVGGIVFKFLYEKDYLQAFFVIIGFFASVIFFGAVIVNISKRKLYELFVGDETSHAD